MSINMLVLTGIVTSDPKPECLYYPSGDIKVNFVLAVEGRDKTVDGVKVPTLEYFPVTAWNSDIGDIVSIVSEGNMILLNGHLKQVEVKDKKTYVVTKKVILVADNIKVIIRKSAVK